MTEAHRGSFAVELRRLVFGEKLQRMLGSAVISHIKRMVDFF